MKGKDHAKPLAHATLVDVAAHANVSVATASRALRGGQVSKKSLAKVMAAVADVGYIPNETARNLKGVRTQTMGIVHFHLTPTSSHELLDALTAVIEEAGYCLFISTARGQPDRYDMLVRRFIERRVDALFCAHAIGEGAVLEQAERAGLPVLALFSREQGYGNVPLLGGSIGEASRQAVEKLKELGHTKIVLITSPGQSPALPAFAAVARQLDLEVIRYTPNIGQLDAISLVSNLVSDGGGPTAVVALYSDAVAIMGACVDMKVRVPEEFSLLSIGDHGPYPALGTQSLSAIRTSPGIVGRAAGELMLEWLRGSRPKESSSIDIGTWIERSTTGPAPQRKRQRLWTN